jgi:coenzyme F420 hydrogenase subunit beta
VVAAIARTDMGQKLVQGAADAGYIECSPHDPAMVTSSGMGWESKKHANMLRLIERKRFGWPTPDYQYALGQDALKRKMTFPT